MKLRLAHDINGSVAVRWTRAAGGSRLMDDSVDACRSRRGRWGSTCRELEPGHYYGAGAGGEEGRAGAAGEEG